MILKIHQTPVTDPSPIPPSTESAKVPSENELLAQDVDEGIKDLISDPEMDMLYRDVKNIRDQVNLVHINNASAKHLSAHVSEYLSSFFVDRI